MSPEQARKFAQEWVAAWNTHDVTKLMTYCAEEFEMSSPLVSDVGAGASGTVKGREAVGEYWGNMLVRAPGLRFDLVNVLTGVSSIIVVFRLINRRLAAQVLEFNPEGKIVRGEAYFSM